MSVINLWPYARSYKFSSKVAETHSEELKELSKLSCSCNDMNDFRTNHFQLGDTSLEIINDNGPSKKINFTDIDSIQIYEDSKYSFKKFTIIYWTVWLLFSLAIDFWNTGPEYAFELFKNVKFWVILLALGLLAYRPTFSIFPSTTFMDIQSHEQKIKVPIGDIVEDGRIHGLIERLKQRLDIDKIKIKK